MILLHYDLQSLPPLHAAASNGDAAEIARLLELGADIEARANAATGYSEAAKRALTPLMVAAGSVFGSAAAVRLLLQQGANPRALSDAGVDALWYAAGAGDPERAAMLLAMGGNPHGVSADGYCAVAQAARSGNAETLSLLLREGASPHPPSGPAEYVAIEGERIPIFAAATSGSAACVRLLLEQGADATARDSAGRTAVMHAGGPEVIPLLIAAGCALEARDPSGWSALDKALIDRNTATMDAMRAAPDVGDMRILEPDIQRRQTEVITGLLDAGADLEACDEHGRTALLHACLYAVAAPLIELLIKRGANIHARDADGRSALHLLSGKREHIQLLIDAGVPVDVRDSQSCTPLHLAIQKRYGNLEAINTLLDQGTDIEARTADDLTPLMLAAKSPEQPDTLVTLLLRRGAQMGASTSDGRTGRAYAAEHVAELEAQIGAQDAQSSDAGRALVAAVERRLALRRAYAALATLDHAAGYITQPLLLGAPALPAPIWLGYRKQGQRLAAPSLEYYGVEDIPIVELCTFGHAIWMDSANAASCFRSERTASMWFTEMEEEQETAALYAYRVFPLLFDTSGSPRPVKAFQLLGKGVGKPRPPDPARYSWLGYDVRTYAVARLCANVACSNPCNNSLGPARNCIIAGRMISSLLSNQLTPVVMR
jgi:ankyrin repeat protein